MIRSLARLSLVFAALSPVAALADQIDGDWCHEGLHVEIIGPQITTPGGHTIIGEYTRHSFDYVVPDGENNAGGSVAMRQMNDDMVRVETKDAGGTALGEPVVWRKCQVTS